MRRVLSATCTDTMDNECLRKSDYKMSNILLTTYILSIIERTTLLASVTIAIRSASSVHLVASIGVRAAANSRLTDAAEIRNVRIVPTLNLGCRRRSPASVSPILGLAVLTATAIDSIDLTVTAAAHLGKLFEILESELLLMVGVIS